MFPVFGDERRRPINLGGASSVPSQASILQEVRARRSERQDVKHRHEKATRLQAWWRGLRAARAARYEIRNMFDRNVTNLTGLRCLLFIGRDEDVLGKWSITMSSHGEGTRYHNRACIRTHENLSFDAANLFEPATGPHRNSWITLIRKACLLLLRSTARFPE